MAVHQRKPIFINGKCYDLSIKDIAEETGYSEGHVTRMARLGEIPSIKRRRSYFFNKEDVMAALTDNGVLVRESMKVTPPNDDLTGL